MIVFTNGGNDMIEISKEERRASVREGYQILLRAKAELILPTAQTEIARYYSELANKCMEWATDVEGERLRREFLSMEDTRDRAHFRMRDYRFSMRYVWESEEAVAVLCESRLTGQTGLNERSYHRLSHVWNVAEQTILPARQILSQFGLSRIPAEVPFRPDGIYPEGNALLFFKNPRERDSFAEVKVPILL